MLAHSLVQFAASVQHVEAASFLQVIRNAVPIFLLIVFLIGTVIGGPSDGPAAGGRAPVLTWGDGCSDAYFADIVHCGPTSRSGFSGIHVGPRNMLACQQPAPVFGRVWRACVGTMRNLWSRLANRPIMCSNIWPRTAYQHC
jgi:hypothetical protein